MHTHMHTCTPRVHTHTLTACKRELSSPPSDSNAAKRGRRNVRDSKVGGRDGVAKSSMAYWHEARVVEGVRVGLVQGAGV